MQCKVDNIADAVRDLGDAGFTVEWGKRPDRAKNALIWFDEGPFLELFELSARARSARIPARALYGRGLANRVVKWAAAEEGWCDLALETDEAELTGVREHLRTGDAGIGRVVKGRRTRPDGQVVRYQFGTPVDPALPFVVSQYRPVQRPSRTVHPNGATGVVAIEFGVREDHRTALSHMIVEDRWLDLVPAPDTGVRSVTIAGITAPLDPALLHNAVIVPHR